MSALLNPSLFHVKQKYTSHIFFLWNNIPLNYVSGKKGEFGLSAVITALKNEYCPGSTKGRGNRCRRYMHSSVAAALSRVRMVLESGRHWMNTQHDQNFANCVGVSPQCYICKYVVTNSSKDILCVIFHEHLLLHGDTNEEREVCNSICGIFHFPLPISVSGSSSCG